MLRSLLFLMAMLSSLALADQDMSQIKPLKARGFFKSQLLGPDQLANVQFELQLQDGFFAYQDKFRLKVTSPTNSEVGELFLSPIVDFDDSNKKRKKGITKEATLETQVRVPRSIHSTIKQFDFELTYIACTKKFCLTPRTLEVAVEVPAIENLQPHDSSAESVDATALIEKNLNDNLLYAFLLIFFFGILTSLTPCIYPLIPITLAVIGSGEGRSKLQSFAVSLAYVLGIGLTYATLGVIAAQTGQLFGSFISHPAVALTMAALFFAMGLSLMGLFELQPPAALRNRMANSQSQRGVLGALIAGLFAGVIASPCVGPVLVGILTYIARTQDSFLGFFLLFTFALGFGVLFLVLGTFSQLSQKLPRSGAWMNTIKTILALSLFSLSFYYAWPAVKKWTVSNTSGQEKVSKINWQPFSMVKVEEAKQKGQPVIIDFYADWCLACVEMDKFTFTEKPVYERAEKFMMLKVDATSPFPELTSWQQKYNVYGLPTMIFINKDGVVRKDLTLTGFEKAEDFAKRMDKVLKSQEGIAKPK